nr:RNA polymerase [Lupinus mosaic virus]
SGEVAWFRKQLKGNLQAVGKSQSQLVTKHVVKGKCPLFEIYLKENPAADEYFKPLMGAYGKSRLNKEAYTKDLMKYSKIIEVGTVDVGVFEQAVCSVKAMLKEIGFKECKFVTDEDDIFNSLNMKSAVGALYAGKKKDYFADYTQTDKELILKESCKRLFLGKLGIWNGALKAELRPIEKVLANKTRTFTAAPIDTLLSGKVCVDDFNNQFYDLHTKGPWSVGITKFYGGWNELLSQLPNGWVYCDADGSQFDSSLTPYLINAVLDIRLSLMEEFPLGHHMLRNLYTEIIYTPILAADGTVVKKFRGNNSGQPSTVVDNSLMVILAMQYSLIKLGYTPSEHRNVCVYYANGDDLLLAVDKKHEKILDGLQECFSTLGLNYDFTSRHTDKEKLWFMSHKGLHIDEMYIPKLEKERIVSILEWDRATEPQHRLEAICAAMVESWGYPELTHEIRKFYAWVLEQAPYTNLASIGKAPYISEVALRRLYTNIEASEQEIETFIHMVEQLEEDEPIDNEVYHQ